MSEVIFWLITCTGLSRSHPKTRVSQVIAGFIKERVRYTWLVYRREEADFVAITLGEGILRRIHIGPGHM